MRTKFPNRQLAHVWAQHNAEPESATPNEGSGHNFFYRADTIYSYGSHFPIARFVERKGQRAVLFTTRGYSVTTSKHIGYARQAVPDSVPVFYLHEPTSPDHKKAWKDYGQRIAAANLSAKRARTRRDYYLSRVADTMAEANAYAAFFGLRTRYTSPEGVTKSLEAAQKREAAARKAEEKRRDAELQEALATWRAGGYADGLYQLRNVALRVRGEEVETTKGARVPVDHAKRLWPIIKRAVETGQGYRRNGHTEHVGHFAVDEITTDGTLRAGCHTIKFDELRRLALQLGMEG